MVAGNILTIGSALAIIGTGNKWLGMVLVIASMAVFMAGVVYLVDPHERFAQLEGRTTLMWWGLGSGVAAILVAFAIEVVLEQRLEFPIALDLWLSGPVEETCMLAIPVLLLAFGSHIFKDPRAGLFLVLLSGIVFGAVEAGEYVANPKEWLPLSMALERPATELLHPFLTAFAASIIWLAAWRAGKVITKAGISAWVIVMAIHSVHDGMLSGGVQGTTLSQPTIPSAADAIASGGAGFLFGAVWTVLLYLLLRHSARELVPPNAVGANAAHWRPTLRQWGVAKKSA